MICEKCGATVDGDAKFCVVCGSQVQTAFTSTDQQPNIVSADIKNEPVQISTAEGSPIVPEKKKKSKEALRKKLRLYAILASIALLLVIGIIIAINIINSPFNRFKSRLSDNDYESALEIYYDDIYGNSKEEDRVQKYLTSHIEDISARYDNSSVNYMDSIHSLDVVSELDIYEGEGLSEAYTHIEELEASRTAFASAELLLEEKDYVNAIKLYRTVILTDDNYSNAQTQLVKASDSYRNETISKAEELSRDNDFDQAITVISSALIILPNDSDLEQQLTLCESNKVKYVKTSALSSSDEYIKQGEYAMALDTLAEAIAIVPEDVDLQKALTDCQESYLTNIKKEADAAFGLECNYQAASSIIQAGFVQLPNNSGLISYDQDLQARYVDYVISSTDAVFAVDRNYETAVRSIEAALAILPGNSSLNAKKDEFLTYKPIWLSDLDYFNISSLDIDAENIVMKDNLGNGYTRVFTSLNGWDGGFVEYVVNGSYSKLDFTCAIPFQYRATDRSQYVEVFGDGTLLFSSNIMTGGVEPQAATLDITGVNKIKIVINSNSYASSCYVGVWDAKLSK